MTLKLWLKKSKLNYSKDIFDIVQFGSSLIEGNNPNDADIAVIFQKIPLKEQINQAQAIKKQLQKISDLPIHIKSFDLYSLFEPSNFAKESILFGKSLISKDFFSRKFGLFPKLQIFYSLKKFEKKDKIKFNYMFSGKQGKYGLLKKYGGKLMRPGLIEIDPLFENIFLNALKNSNSKFEIKKIFEII